MGTRRLGHCFHVGCHEYRISLEENSGEPSSPCDDLRSYSLHDGLEICPQDSRFESTSRSK
jgi:hypothetical protein